MNNQQEGTERKDRWWWRAVVMALFCATAIAVFNASGSVLLAQSDAPAASAVQEITPDEVNQVARKLWCPLCSGVRLDACELKACDQMKDVIAIKLAEGEDTESIQAYFVEQYGPQVMGEPPREGFNWLAWILPVVAVIAGGFIFWRTTQRMMQPALALPDYPGPDGVAGAQGSQSSLRAEPKAANGEDDEDEYTQRLEEELAKYG